MGGGRLEQAYLTAFAEWDASDERWAWEAIVGDGVDGHRRGAPDPPIGFDCNAGTADRVVGAWTAPT